MMRIKEAFVLPVVPYRSMTPFERFWIRDVIEMARDRETSTLRLRFDPCASIVYGARKIDKHSVQVSELSAREFFGPELRQAKNCFANENLGGGVFIADLKRRVGEEDKTSLMWMGGKNKHYGRASFFRSVLVNGKVHPLHLGYSKRAVELAPSGWYTITVEIELDLEEPSE